MEWKFSLKQKSITHDLFYSAGQGRFISAAGKSCCSARYQGLVQTVNVGPRIKLLWVSVSAHPCCWKLNFATLQKSLFIPCKHYWWLYCHGFLSALVFLALTLRVVLPICSSPGSVRGLCVPRFQVLNVLFLFQTVQTGIEMEGKCWEWRGEHRICPVPGVNFTPRLSLFAQVLQNSWITLREKGKTERSRRGQWSRGKDETKRSEMRWGGYWQRQSLQRWGGHQFLV